MHGALCFTVHLHISWLPLLSLTHTLSSHFIREIQNISHSSQYAATAPWAPPLFNGTPTSIVRGAKRLIDHSRKLQDDVVRNVKTNEATFANVLGPLSHTENALHVESNILCFYKEVPTDSELRDASGEAQKLLSGFAIETAMREDIFQLVNAIVDKNEALDPESSHLLQKQHKDTSETD